MCVIKDYSVIYYLFCDHCAVAGCNFMYLTLARRGIQYIEAILTVTLTFMCA